MTPIATAAEATVEVGGTTGTVVFVALVLGSIAVTVLVLARPWELRGGSFLDKLRIADAVSSYDFWLGWQGVGGRARRTARTELRANLWEATQQVGAREAVRALGPLRTLARDSGLQPTGPRWGWGAVAGFVALEVVVAVQLLVTTVVVDTAQAAGVPQLEVDVTAVPGMTVTYAEPAGGGLEFGMSLGPAPIVAGLVAFLVAARPWRLLRRGQPVPA